MIYFLLFLIVSFAIGCIAKYRQFAKRVNNPRRYHGPINQAEQKRHNSVLWFYVISVFTILFGYQAVSNSYFDLLSLEFLFLFLWCIWLTALWGEYMLPGSVVKFYDEEGSRLFHYLLVFLLLVGGILILSFASPLWQTISKG